MKKYLLIACLFALFLFGPSLLTSAFVSKNTVASQIPTQRPLDAEVLWSLIQTWRQSDDCRPGGCQPYIKDQRLCGIAEDRVNDGLDYHEGLYEKYSDYQFVIQENIVRSDANEQAALYWWLSSKPHVTTLKKDYVYSCVATKGNFAVQIFSNME